MQIPSRDERGRDSRYFLAAEDAGYLAESEDAVKEHAKLSGFPASKITEVRSIIDPTTAN